MALLVLNEFVGAALLLAGVGAFAPFLASLLGGTGVPPGPLEDILSWLGVLAWAPAELLAFLVAMLVFRVLLDGVRKYVAGAIGVHLSRVLRMCINDSITRKNWEEFLRVDQGKFIQCMIAESSQASGAVNAFASAFGAGLLAILLLGWLALYSVETFVILVLGGTLFLLTSKRLFTALRKISERRIRLMARMNTKVTDTQHTFKFLFAESLIGTMGSMIVSLVQSIASAERRQLLFSVFVGYYVQLFGVVLIALISAAHLLYLDTDGATIVFDLVLIQRISTYFGDFQTRRAAMARTIPSYAACLDMMHPKFEPQGDQRGTATIGTLKTGIDVEQVSFSFETRTPVLKDVTLHLPPKGLVFFIGPSGSGKTTLVDIIFGLLSPPEGRIFVDGVDLANLNQAHWRGQVAYVPQDAYILAGTLRDYLAFGREDVEDDRIWAALERAGAKGFVRALPHGIETVVRPGGTDLSGGERQRLSIARSLIRSAKLLVLDEPSSALDKESEQTLFDSLRSLSDRMLIVVVTHSTGAVRSNDHVYHFSNGAAVRRRGTAFPRDSASAVPDSDSSCRIAEPFHLQE